MGAKNAAVHMRFIDHHKPEAAEQARPGLMVGQDADVQHIRVGNEDARPFFDLGTRSQRGVPVKSVAFFRKDDLGTKLLTESAQLVLGQGFSGKEVHSPAAFFALHGLQDRDVIAQGLAAGAGSSDHHVAPLKGLVDGLGLMGIKGQKGIIVQAVLQAFRQGAFQFRVAGLAGRDFFDVGDLVAILGPGG